MRPLATVCDGLTLSQWATQEARVLCSTSRRPAFSSHRGGSRRGHRGGTHIFMGASQGVGAGRLASPPEFTPRVAGREACVGSPIPTRVADEVDGPHLCLDGVSERYVSGPAVASAAISRSSQSSPRCWRVNSRARSDSITSTLSPGASSRQSFGRSFIHGRQPRESLEVDQFEALMGLSAWSCQSCTNGRRSTCAPAP